MSRAVLLLLKIVASHTFTICPTFSIALLVPLAENLQSGEYKNAIYLFFKSFWKRNIKRNIAI